MVGANYFQMVQKKIYIDNANKARVISSVCWNYSKDIVGKLLPMVISFR